MQTGSRIESRQMKARDLRAHFPIDFHQTPIVFAGSDADAMRLRQMGLQAVRWRGEADNGVLLSILARTCAHSLVIVGSDQMPPGLAYAADLAAGKARRYVQVLGIDRAAFDGARTRADVLREIFAGVAA